MWSDCILSDLIDYDFVCACTQGFRAVQCQHYKECAFLSAEREKIHSAAEELVSDCSFSHALSLIAHKHHPNTHMLQSRIQNPEMDSLFTILNNSLQTQQRTCNLVNMLTQQ